MDMLVDRLSKLREEVNPHSVAVLKEDSSILMDDIFSQFMQAYGSPNLIDASDREGQYLAFKMTQGLDGPVRGKVDQMGGGGIARISIPDLVTGGI